MPDQEEVEEFKLTPEQVAEVQETWTTLKASRGQVYKKKRELALAEAENKAASIRFWAILETMFPRTTEGGTWKYNEDKGTVERQEDEEPSGGKMMFGPFPFQ